MAEKERRGRAGKAAAAKQRVRVHVGVARPLQRRLEEGGDLAIEDWARERGLDKVNKERLRRFGVLTGETSEERAEALSSEEGVEFVEKDEIRKAI